MPFLMVALLTCLKGADPMTTAVTASPAFRLAKGLFFDMLSEASSASVICTLPCSPAWRETL